MIEPIELPYLLSKLEPTGEKKWGFIFGFIPWKLPILEEIFLVGYGTYELADVRTVEQYFEDDGTEASDDSCIVRFYNTDTTLLCYASYDVVCELIEPTKKTPIGYDVTSNKTKRTRKKSD